MKSLLAVVSVLLFSLSTSAFAVCQKDGQTYQTGAQVGPFTCMADGSWRRWCSIAFCLRLMRKDVDAKFACLEGLASGPTLGLSCVS